jgi:hypothetical protein
VEARTLSVATPRLDEKHGIEDRVAVVARFAGEVELRRQYRPIRSLHLHVDVARPARVQARDDRLQPVTTACVGKLVAAQAVTLIVVLPLGIRVPEVEQCPAAGLQSVARTEPASTSLVPSIPGSRKDARSGESGVKNGPSVCSTVGSSPSSQAGVGASVVVLPSVAVAATVPDSSPRLHAGSSSGRGSTRPSSSSRLRVSSRCSSMAES